MDNNLAPLLSEVDDLEKKIKEINLPPELKEKSLQMIQRLGRMARFGEYTTEYEKTSHYLDWISGLPWTTRSQDALDLVNAKKVLDKNHYGLDTIKERLLEYLSVLSLRKDKGGIQRAPILCFVGLVGTGKTTIASSIAEAMGRKFARVPFGGLGDPLDLRGQSRLRPDAEPGLIIKALRRAGTKNPVILLDEIDRVSDEALNTIMGVLVELLDPEQNSRFIDHYIDYPFDLSQAFFVATCNNTSRIATAVMDRLEVIQMPSYTDEEKTAIGRDYLFPKALVESGLSPKELIISPNVWLQVVRPLGFDAGVRTLKRNIEGLCRKAAKLIFEGQTKQVVVDESNIKQFVPQW